MMTVVWLVLLVLVLIAEAVALSIGGTLSVHVWAILDHPVGRAVLVALWAWLTWHWFLEHWFWPTGRHMWWDDALIVGVWALLSTIIGRRRPSTPEGGS